VLPGLPQQEQLQQEQLQQEQEQQQQQQQQQCGGGVGAALLARLQHRSPLGGAGQAHRQQWHEQQQQQDGQQVTRLQQQAAPQPAVQAQGLSDSRAAAVLQQLQQLVQQRDKELGCVRALLEQLRQELAAAKLQPSAQQLPAGSSSWLAADVSAVPQLGDEQLVARRVSALLQGQANSALPPALLSGLTNSNFRQVAPAAHATAQQLMQQQAASVCQGVGPLPPGKQGPLGGGDGSAGCLGQSELDPAAAAQEALCRAISLMDTRPTGYYGLEGIQQPVLPISEQLFCEAARQQSQQVHTGQLLLVPGAGGGYVNAGLRMDARPLVSDPAKLADKMLGTAQGERAMIAMLQDMARRDLVTAATLPMWLKHMAAWRWLAERFSGKGNWGGFLAV
jgi:hypothetical protein